MKPITRAAGGIWVAKGMMWILVREYIAICTGKRPHVCSAMSQLRGLQEKNEGTTLGLGL